MKSGSPLNKASAIIKYCLICKLTENQVSSLILYFLRFFKNWLTMSYTVQTGILKHLWTRLGGCDGQSPLNTIFLFICSDFYEIFVDIFQNILIQKEKNISMQSQLSSENTTSTNLWTMAVWSLNAPLVQMNYKCQSVVYVWWVAKILWWVAEFGRIISIIN